MDEGRNHEDAAQLRKVVSALEEEVSFLRRRLRESPAKSDELEAQLAKAQERLDRVVNQNDKLSGLLEEAREQLGVLREEVEKLTQPPNNFGTVLKVSEDGTVDVHHRQSQAPGRRPALGRGQEAPDRPGGPPQRGLQHHRHPLLRAGR